MITYILGAVGAYYGAKKSPGTAAGYAAGGALVGSVLDGLLLGAVGVLAVTSFANKQMSSGASSTSKVSGLGGLKVPVFPAGSAQDRPVYKIRPAKA